MKKEEWKKIKEFEHYQVSSFGRVKSLKFDKEKILKQNKSGSGYLNISLYKDSKPKTITVHKLVAIGFLNHITSGCNIIVDHIDNNKSNNRLDNLQIITQRLNVSKDKKTKFTGVYKSKNKWRSRIKVNGKNIHLGLFNTEEEASKKYQSYLKTLNK